MLGVHDVPDPALAQPGRERRAQAKHPARVVPELVASGPDQVFSWDITKLKGPVKGCYYDAYVIMDIYSRKIIHCQVHAGESGPLARDFPANTIIANGGTAPRWVHSDNGTSMTSKTVAALLAATSPGPCPGRTPQTTTPTPRRCSRP